MPNYARDVLSGDTRRRPPVAEVAAEPGLVVETDDGRFCGAVVEMTRETVTLEDRHGRQRVFRLAPAAFRLDGQPVTLVRPVRSPAGRRRTASGSYAVSATARVARGSRIWVEGLHDAALVERIWGDDLRVEGVVVEPLDGIDGLAERLSRFNPDPQNRVGVLVDHLVPGSKESRLVEGLRQPDVLVTGHPYVDVWQAVKPAAVGIAAWPTIPRGTDWKAGVCAALGVTDPWEMWRRVLAGVNGFADLEVPLLRAVEELIDFVTA